MSENGQEKGIHFTELPEAKPGEALAEEWNTYRREVGRLLTEGREGKFVLIKDTMIVGIFDTWDAARAEGLKRYLLQPMLVHEIRTFEPILSVRGYNLPWPNSFSQFLPAGLAVPVLIGLDGQTTTALRAAGQPILPPVLALGLLDTCTTVTSVAAWVLQQLGLTATSSGKTQTASGTVAVNLFTVSLSVTDLNQPGSTWLTQPDLLVVELPTVLSDADVLIGLDVLLECKLLLDGPAKQFMLEF